MPSPNAPAIHLFAPADAAQWTQARTLMREYVQGLNLDLSFQDVDAELAALPGTYAPPRGAVLLASVDGALAACGAFRPRPDVAIVNACEMKRLYARGAFRGLGLGRRVAEALVERARVAGYSAMLLDTLADMASAQALYAALGFREIAPYYANPLAGTRYLQLDLA